MAHQGERRGQSNQSNPPFLIFDIRALRTECQSARMSEIKNGGLDQYGAEPSEQQHLGTAGVEGVNKVEAQQNRGINSVDSRHRWSSGSECRH